MINTFVKALLYQPTNYMSCEMEPGSDVPTPANSFEQVPTYLEEPSKILPSYLYEQFRYLTSTTLDEESPEVASCAGAEGHPHKFLAATGFEICYNCDQKVCIKCINKNGEKGFCLQCSATE